MYGSWDMERDGHKFLSFGPFFALYPSNNLKNQNFGKMKKMPGDIIILQKCTKNHDMLYCSWDMVCDGCNCYFSFWAFFVPFYLLKAQKISSFYTCVPKIMIRSCTAAEIWCTMDGLMDGQTSFIKHLQWPLLVV